MTCRCGCAAATHLHYRAGTDCGHCGAARCPAFVPHDFTDDQAAAYLALAPYALAAPDVPEHPASSQADDDEDGEHHP